MVFRNFLGENRRGATYASLTDLLSVSDIVSLHLPYSRDTHHVIGSRELSLMKNTAFLINTSRGRNVDELALIEALEKRVIAGAGLDVFHDEPAIPEKLKKLSNIVMTPHIGSATAKARNGMARVVAENIIAHSEGKNPPNVIPELK